MDKKSDKKKTIKGQSFNILLNKYFKEGLIFSNKLRNYFLFSLVLFFAVFIFGIFFPNLFREQILELIQNIIKQTEGLGSLELTGFIMFNNLKSAFFSMSLGIFMGIFPLLIIIINGYVLGFVSHSVIDLNNGLLLWRLLPHGIFEIPAIMIASGLGLYLGISWIRNCIVNSTKRKFSELQIYLLIILSILCAPISFLILIIITSLNSKVRELLWLDIKNLLKTFIFIVIPLLVIAAIIEGWLIWVLG